MKCSIVRELLPAYIEGVTSKETNGDIKEHLEDCEGCRGVYESMAAALPRYTGPAEDNRKLIKKLKGRLRRNNAIAVILVCLAFFLIVFAMYYEVPLPFDANRMSVERVQAVFLNDETFGDFIATPVDHMDYQETKEFQTGKYKTYNLAWFSYRGINNAGYTFRSRIIERNGEKVRVTYICFFKTLWDIIFFGDLQGYSESGAFSGDMYHGCVTESQDEYEPVQTEIYYLPQRGMVTLSTIDDLTDEEFDALKEKASLIWNDVT